MDKRLSIFKIFAQQVCNWFGDKLTADVCYTYDGNNVEIRFHGYPLYPSGRRGDVILLLPVGYVSISSVSGVKFGRINQGHVKIYQGSIGKAYAHPHVWGNGEPCWNHIDKSNVTDLFCWVVHSLLLTNVTIDSLTKGRPCPDSGMLADTYAEIMALARKQQSVLRVKLNLPRDVFDLRTLNSVFMSRFMASVNIVLR